MLILMASALLMAVGMHYAFSCRAGLFVFAYVTVTLARAGYMVLVMRDTQMAKNDAQLGA